MLFWGILGAIVLRGAMIAAGAALIHAFDWIFYVFGAFLLYSGRHAAQGRRRRAVRPEQKRARADRAARSSRSPTSCDGERFFIDVDGARAATPLFVRCCSSSSTDVVFALDSIPAVFAVTQEPFIVFTSNIFAILGLRSLYFVLAGLMTMFKYIKLSLIFILAFVGVKMLLHHHIEIPHAISLGVIVGFLAIGVLASLWSTRREQRTQ